MTSAQSRPNALRRLGVTLVVTAVLAAVPLAYAGAPAAPEFLVPDGSRAPAVHRIPVLNEDGKPVDPTEPLGMPYSPRTTCSGKCHNYETIENGWHFNAGDPKVDPGRPGQPWVLLDLKTGTQLPVSGRAWPNTFRPADVGVTPWKFTVKFGTHTPGGGYGEKWSETKPPDMDARWDVSGKLTIDCMACHSGDPEYDGSQWATNIEKENLRWAATAASAFGHLKGIAKTMPDAWDYMMPPSGDDPKQFPPQLKYDTWRFNANKEVFFNTPSQSPVGRCYYCHTNHPTGEAGESVVDDEDVHMKSGLTCTDCHRNGIDHMMTRNYEGEPSPAGQPSRASLTCRGCHLGEQSAAAGPGTMGGRLGAPMPKHVGIPTVHFEKLSCTTCHSGPKPGKQTVRVQTAAIHGLGVKAKEHRDDAPPFVQWPVFIRQTSGVIAPHKMVWPAYWGRLKDSAVKPMAPAEVTAVVTEGLAPGRMKSWKPLTEEQITKALTTLAGQKSPNGEPGYVAGGRLYRLVEGKLSGAEHAAAAPYSWPVAHEVRPAAQSLGSGGCTDCHASDAPIAFGEVVADSPADLGPPLVKIMYEFQGRDKTQLLAWAMSYTFRPMFKVVGYTTAGVIAAVLVLYFFLGILALVRWAARKAPQP